MSHSLADNYVRSQGLYRLEYIEWQLANDSSFQEKDINLEKLIHYSLQDGYESLQQTLGQWFINSAIEEQDVIEYLFMKAHPELFELEEQGSILE